MIFILHVEMWKIICDCQFVSIVRFRLDVSFGFASTASFEIELENIRSDRTLTFNKLRFENARPPSTFCDISSLLCETVYFRTGDIICSFFFSFPPSPGNRHLTPLRWWSQIPCPLQIFSPS
jgi:hypothetical protein